MASFTYAGVTDTFIYDNDGLLTNAGDYSVGRKPSNGLPDSVIGNDLSISRGFNGHGEVESQNFAVNGITVASWSVVRDNNGRITNKTETADSITSEFVYNYDDAGRLLTVTKDGTVVEEYGYGDPNSGLPAGIRTYERKGAVERRYTYSDEDHLTSIDDGTSFTYCPDGFLGTKTTADGTTVYDYSSRGELLSATLPDNRIVSYVHDPIGRRIAKKIDGVVVEKYLWNGRTQLVAVFNADDSLKIRFEYADARMPVSMEMGGQRYYPAYDQVGSLRIVADSSGNVVKRIDYDSFGNISDDSDTLFEIPFGFAGGLRDRDTGLVRFGYRDYDPGVGRWTAKDPIGFAGGDTDLFGYCFNDPMNSIDPDGLQKNSVDTSIEQAAARGNTAELEALFETTGNPAAKAAIKRLNTKAIDLIKGQLRRSKSYASELENKTMAELIKLAKGNCKDAKKASKMIKLIKDSKRLLDKLGAH